MTLQAGPSLPANAPYLVISRIGPDSLHAEWLPAAGPGMFDVLLSSYDPAIAPVERPAASGRREQRTGCGPRHEPGGIRTGLRGAPYAPPPDGEYPAGGEPPPVEECTSDGG